MGNLLARLSRGWLHEQRSSLDQELALEGDVGGHGLAALVERGTPVHVAHGGFAGVREAGIGLAHRAEELQLAAGQHAQLDAGHTLDALRPGALRVVALERLVEQVPARWLRPAAQVALAHHTYARAAHHAALDAGAIATGYRGVGLADRARHGLVVPDRARPATSALTGERGPAEVGQRLFSCGRRLG